MALPEAVEAFLAVDQVALPDAALGPRIAELEELLRRAQAAQAEAVRLFDARAVAGSEGAASTACWLRDRLGAAESEARRLVGLARSLDRLPLLAAALRAGTVTTAHVRTLAARTRFLDPGTVAAGEPYLAELAGRLDPVRFGTAVRRWVAVVAPGDFERDTERRYDARWLAVSPTFGGMTSISGMLDPEGGALVRDALAALVSANPSTDPRSRDQQRADALVDLVELARSHQLLPVTGGHRPEILVHVDPALLAGDPAAAPATLADGTPLPRAAADRLTCDAAFRRLVLDAASVPVSLGRATRLVPPHLRKHVALRDGGCRYPGCPRGAAFCEAHHVVFWRDGGPTDAGNLVLLCRYHHHLVHDRGHTLRLHPDGTVTATRPDGHLLSSRPRGPTTVAV